MRDVDLFQLALALVPPWLVKACNFDAAKKRLDIEIDFARGGRFPCPHCAKADCPVHDTSMQQWRHLDFFQHQAYLHARTPRITCPDCGVKQIAVPWARPDSGFTLLFEALTMTLVTHMPVAAVARLVGEHDTRLWRIINHYVEAALARLDLADLRRVCIDETAAKRGHNYISLCRRRALPARRSSISTGARSSISPMAGMPTRSPSSPSTSTATTPTPLASRKSAST